MTFRGEAPVRCEEPSVNRLFEPELCDFQGYLTFPWVPMAFIALLCVASCVAQIGLRETFDSVLQDSLSKSSSVPASAGANLPASTKRWVNFPVLKLSLES